MSVDLLVPLEVRRDGQLHLQSGPAHTHTQHSTPTKHIHPNLLYYVPGDRLYMHGQLQLGQLVDVFVDGLAHLWHADQLSDLAVAQVVEPLPGEVLLLDPADNVLGELLELSQTATCSAVVGGSVCVCVFVCLFEVVRQ